MIQFIHRSRQLIGGLVCDYCKTKSNDYIDTEYREDKEYDVKWHCNKCGKENIVHMTPTIKGCGMILDTDYGREIIIMPNGQLRKELIFELPKGTEVI